MIIIKKGPPTSRSAPFPSFPLFSAEAVLAYSAEWAYPVLRYIFPCCSRSNSIIRIAYSRIINVTANITYILIHSISSSSVRFQNLFALISINHKAYILRSLSAPVLLINSTINRFLNLYYILLFLVVFTGTDSGGTHRNSSCLLQGDHEADTQFTGTVEREASASYQGESGGRMLPNIVKRIVFRRSARFTILSNTCENTPILYRW